MSDQLDLPKTSTQMTELAELSWPWLCQAVTGRPTRLLTEVRFEPWIAEDGGVRGGEKLWVCAPCLARGVVTTTDD